jgi:DNA-directed RNA polymerase subunit M/transcription elongation factor TFIIS
MNREAGTSALQTILKNPKNIKILENKVAKYAASKIDSSKSYNRLIYQVCGDIMASKKLVTILASLVVTKLEWNHKMYDVIRANIKEQDDFTECPFEVEEGVLTCGCGSSKVFSYCKQTKGGDEGTTSFAKCMECNASWTEGG